MPSIVAEVLQSTGKLAKENIVLKVDGLKRKLDVLKAEVQETLEHVYIDFIPQYIKLDKLLIRLKQFSNDYEHLHNQIEKQIKPQLVNSVAEFHDVLDDLKKTKVLKDVAQNLVFLHQHLEEAKTNKLHLLYLNAAHCLIEFDTVFLEMDSNNIKDIAILSALKIEFHVTKQDIICDIENIWKRNVVISSHMEGRNKKCVIISINKETFGYEELFKALHVLKYLRPILREFGKQYLKSICEVLLFNNVKISIDNVTCILTIDILCEQSPQPSEVFESLKKVFLFIYKELFQWPLSEDSELSAMNELGAVISEDFCSLIIENCLKTAIPKQHEQLEAFHGKVVATENFFNTLKAIGFFDESNSPLLNFIKNADILPMNKMAQDILSRARFLMQKSLHQTVAYGIEYSQVTSVENSHDLKEMAQTKRGLSKATFLFPKCQISVFIKDLVKLLKEVKDEAKMIGPTHAPRLYYVGRSICELYCCVVPVFHKEEIQNIPQQTAIFHNNCMYLAHELCTLGSHYECELEAHVPMTFADLIPEIKKLGVEAFLHQMQKQKQQLLQLIKEKQAYETNLIDGGLLQKAKKSISQCLCQLQLLQKVWCDVLSSGVYFKAIGTLLNSCLEEIILRVVSMEDISADATAQIDSIFSILLQQGPDLFKIPDIDQRNFVHLYVRQWFKFQELQLILSASMKEVIDRWSSGKGPLAAHFTADDVKHLIRALFQNTETRAAALAKIR